MTACYRYQHYLCPRRAAVEGVSEKSEVRDLASPRLHLARERAMFPLLSVTGPCNIKRTP